MPPREPPAVRQPACKLPWLLCSAKW